MTKDYRDDPQYYHLRSRFLPAIMVIHDVEAEQAKDKQLLKELMARGGTEAHEAIIEVRRRIYQRRRGKTGLRSLNRKIKRYYEYCCKHDLLY